MYPPKQLLKGFTLIELIMVIIVLAIISAIAIPRFFSTSTFTTANALTELQSALHYARNRAVTAQCAVEFRIDGDGWSALRDEDCISDETTASCPSDPLNFSTALNEAGETTPLTGSSPTSTGLQRLFFTSTGQLYRLTSGSGCTTLPVNAVTPGTTLALSPSGNLRLDGPSGYAALQ